MLKRLLAVAGLLTITFATGSPLLAQEGQGEPKPDEGAPSTDTKPTDEKDEKGETKVGFWGDRFALFVEAAGGSSSAEDLDTSVQTQSIRTSENTLRLDEVLTGRAAIGWKLPYDRGSFRIVFTGYSEDSYTLEATGLRKAVKGTTDVPSTNLPWWHVTARDGRVDSQLIPPTWEDQLRPDPITGEDILDGALQDDEIVYDPENPDLVTATSVPDNAQNRIQTTDFLFLRDFGGRLWGARYSCGLRYLVYQGNLPAAAWLSTSSSSISGGYTEGSAVRLLSFNQDTSGLGPTGSLELRRRLFRNRLELFGEARFAFLITTLNVDSGDFFTLVSQTTGENPPEIAADARIDQTLEKTAWNLGAEIGARVRLAEGLVLYVAWSRMAYQDVILLPFELQIPESEEKIRFGTQGLYSTKDLTLDSLRFGVSFQF